MVVKRKPKELTSVDVSNDVEIVNIPTEAVGTLKKSISSKRDPEFTHKAISTCVIEGVNHFVLVHYNPLTLESGNVTLVPCENQTEMQNTFKIKAVQLGLV